MASSLRDAIAAVAGTATASGATLMLSTTPNEFVQKEMPFVISVVDAAALAAKPKPASGEKKEAGPIDVFESVEPALFVADVHPGYKLLLNKFPVLLQHTVLVSKTFLPQDAALTVADMAAFWSVVRDIRGLGFYNCGPKSGCSQPRRHFQVIPLDVLPSPSGSGSGAVEARPPIDALISAERSRRGGQLLPGAGTVFTLPEYDFQHAICLNGDEIAGMPTPDAAALLLSRLHALVAAAGVDLAATPDASFNILLTPAWMLVAPRSTDTWGGVFINSLGFAGYILVRPGGGEAALRERTPLGVLAEVGVARAAAAAAGAAAGAEGGGGSARA